MADSEKTEKSGKWRKFWNCYQQELFAVFLVFCVIALLDDRDITDYLELLWKRPVSGIGLLVLLFLLAGRQHNVSRLIRQLRQEKDKPE